LAYIAILIALLAGAANPFQSATNGELNKQLHAPVWATVMVYVTGLAGVLLIQAFTREPLPLDKAASVHWWAWTGGVISILATMAGVLFVQKLGSGTFTSLSLTASLIVSVVLDQFGWVGLKQHTASPGRLAGCGLLVVGVWLVSKF
jgi:transporter family-2 protein